MNVEPIPLAVVLVSPRNPLNIGAVARAMSNFGFQDLRLVNAYHVALHEVRSAVNAESVIRDARSYSSLPEAVADCSRVVGATGVEARDLKTAIHRLEQGALDLKISATAGRVALVFGSEKHGLSSDDISHCHALVHIPTRPAHDSMNLGQAVAICLYELVRDAPAEAPSRRVPREAPAAMLELLHEQCFRVLTRSGYVKRRVAASATSKLRQFLRRLRLSAHDATLLLGMVRQVNLALEDPHVREKAARDWDSGHAD